MKYEKYKTGTPFYCKTLWYIAIVLAATTIDWISLYSLYDPVLNGNQTTAIIVSFGIVAVLDLYSCWLPPLLNYMEVRKRNITLGLALMGIIVIISLLSVVFRISTGDAITNSDKVVQLSSMSTVMINLILGCIPIASTIAMLFLSLQREQWKKINKIYRNKQLISYLKTQKKELELSLGETLDLKKLDQEDYRCMAEQIKAYAALLKSRKNIVYATALHDSVSAKELSKSTLPDYISDSLNPAPFSGEMNETNNS